MLRGWVVVLLLRAGGCDEYPGRDCVQSVLVDADGLPFADKEAADAEAARWPDWCAPHTMMFTAADENLG